jgi:succinyl-CoA synthetase beta subunit
MKLHEYQSKRLFASYGVAVPRGAVASTATQACQVAARIGLPVVVKAQVLVGGRGKAGGIRLASTLGQVEELAGDLLDSTIGALPVRTVLVETAAKITQEIYLGVTVDRSAGQPAVMASAQGGVDIEEVARTSPDAMVRLAVDPFLGLRPYHGLALGKGIGLASACLRPLSEVAQCLYRVFCDCDAWLAEINPLAVTDRGDLLALDSKIVLDDNALFRHEDLAELRDSDAETQVERRAREAGMSYVQLHGDIGCLVNGAGLAMATMDAIKLFGGAPANFLDVGGGARAEIVTTALQLMLAAPGIRAALVNIFGGITRCDEVARGIVAALGEREPGIPMVIRLVGTNEDEGRVILQGASARLVPAVSLSEAAQKAVSAAREGARG